MAMAILPVAALSADACTGLYVGKKASVDGTTMLCKTEDDWGMKFWHYGQVVPRRQDGGPGEIRGDFGFRRALPEKTFRYVTFPRSSQYRAPRLVAQALNEAGLVVNGAVTAWPNHEFLRLDPFVPTGTSWETMPDYLAATCVTAREAVESFARVIAEQGNFEGDNYFFADRNEAWYFEAYTGHHWAAVRMPEDCVAALGNQFMLGDVDLAAEGGIPAGQSYGAVTGDSSGLVEHILADIVAHDIALALIKPFGNGTVIACKRGRVKVKRGIRKTCGTRNRRRNFALIFENNAATSNSHGKIRTGCDLVDRKDITSRACLFDAFRRRIEQKRFRLVVALEELPVRQVDLLGRRRFRQSRQHRKIFRKRPPRVTGFRGIAHEKRHRLPGFHRRNVDQVRFDRQAVSLARQRRHRDHVSTRGGQAADGNLSLLRANALDLAPFRRAERQREFAELD